MRGWTTTAAPPASPTSGTAVPSASPTLGTVGVSRPAFTRTLDDTIVIGIGLPTRPIALLRLSPTLASIFPDGVCAVDEFVIQKALFSSANVFVEIHVDDRVYGPFGGPWMTLDRHHHPKVLTSAPRAVRGQHVKMMAFVRGLDVPEKMEIYLRCLVREAVFAATTPSVVKAPMPVGDARCDCAGGDYSGHAVDCDLLRQP